MFRQRYQYRWPKQHSMHPAPSAVSAVVQPGADVGTDSCTAHRPAAPAASKRKAEADTCSSPDDGRLCKRKAGADTCPVTCDVGHAQSATQPQPSSVAPPDETGSCHSLSVNASDEPDQRTATVATPSLPAEHCQHSIASTALPAQHCTFHTHIDKVAPPPETLTPMPSHAHAGSQAGAPGWAGVNKPAAACAQSPGNGVHASNPMPAHAGAGAQLVSPAHVQAWSGVHSSNPSHAHAPWAPAEAVSIPTPAHASHGAQAATPACTHAWGDVNASDAPKRAHAGEGLDASPPTASAPHQVQASAEATTPALPRVSVDIVDLTLSDSDEDSPQQPAADVVDPAAAPGAVRLHPPGRPWAKQPGRGTALGPAHSSRTLRSRAQAGLAAPVSAHHSSGKPQWRSGPGSSEQCAYGAAAQPARRQGSACAVASIGGLLGSELVDDHLDTFSDDEPSPGGADPDTGAPPDPAGGAQLVDIVYDTAVVTTPKCGSAARHGTAAPAARPLLSHLVGIVYAAPSARLLPGTTAHCQIEAHAPPAQPTRSEACTTAVPSHAGGVPSMAATGLRRCGGSTGDHLAGGGCLEAAADDMRGHGREGVSMVAGCGGSLSAPATVSCETEAPAAQPAATQGPSQAPTGSSAVQPRGCATTAIAEGPIGPVTNCLSVPPSVTPGGCQPAAAAEGAPGPVLRCGLTPPSPSAMAPCSTAVSPMMEMTESGAQACQGSAHVSSHKHEASFLPTSCSPASHAIGQEPPSSNTHCPSSSTAVHAYSAQEQTAADAGDGCCIAPRLPTPQQPRQKRPRRDAPQQALAAGAARHQPPTQPGPPPVKPLTVTICPGSHPLLRLNLVAQAPRDPEDLPARGAAAVAADAAPRFKRMAFAGYVQRQPDVNPGERRLLGFTLHPRVARRYSLMGDSSISIGDPESASCKDLRSSQRLVTQLQKLLTERIQAEGRVPEDLPVDVVGKYVVAHNDPRVALRGQWGLRAVRAAPAGTVIGPYRSLVLPMDVYNSFRSQPQSEWPHSPVLWEEMVDKYCVDDHEWKLPEGAMHLNYSAFGFGNLTSLVNDPHVNPWKPGDTAQVGVANARIQFLTFNTLPLPFLVLTRAVRAGEEVMYAYGQEYFRLLAELEQRRCEINKWMRRVLQQQEQLGNAALCQVAPWLHPPEALSQRPGSEECDG